MPTRATSASRPTLLAIGWATHGTGFARVLEEILRPLSDTFHIHQVGIGYHGPTVQHDWTVHPIESDGSDVFGAFAAKKLIADISPDAIFILHDIWMLEYYFRVFADITQLPPIVTYCPLDGRIPTPALAQPLLQAHTLVTYTDGAQRDLENALRICASSQTTPQSSPQVLSIPHGVDTTSFKPLFSPNATTAEKQLKQEVFGELGYDTPEFVVLNASRPDQRKRLDITLRGFAAFCENKPPGVRLYLHHAIPSATVTNDLQQLAQELNISNRIIWSKPNNAPLSDKQLNRLYNACDVGLNTSSGEGWGLVSFEHAAAGRPQIVPNHSACQDLWADAALLAPVTHYEVPPYSMLEMAEVSISGVAEALQQLYEDKGLRLDLAEKGRNRATQTKWLWPAVAVQWEHLFTSVVNEQALTVS